MIWYAGGPVETVTKNKNLMIYLKLEDDYRSAKSYQTSILHDICKGGYFGANLVDSKDSKLLFALAESLLQNKVWN